MSWPHKPLQQQTSADEVAAFVLWLAVRVQTYKKINKKIINTTLSFWSELELKKQRSDGQRVPPGVDAVPHDAVFIWRMARGQEDPR